MPLDYTTAPHLISLSHRLLTAIKFLVSGQEMILGRGSWYLGLGRGLEFEMVVIGLKLGRGLEFQIIVSGCGVPVLALAVGIWSLLQDRDFRSSS